MAVSLAPQSAKSSRGSLVFIILGVLVLVGGVAYWYMSYTPKEDATVVVSSGEEVPSQAALTPEAPQTELDKEAAEVLAAVAIIKKIQLDTKFFEDSRFTALKDTPIDIPTVKPSGNYQFRFVAPPSDKENKK